MRERILRKILVYLSLRIRIKMISFARKKDNLKEIAQQGKLWK